MESPSFCAQCGNKMQAGAKFCQGCGCQIAQASVSGEGIPSDAASSPPVAHEPLSGQARKTEPIFAQRSPIESSNRPDDAGSSGLLTNRVFFVLIYLVFVTPTYVLPYFGSNSALLNATGAALGSGALPQFWYHLIALYILLVIAWLRGAHTGRAWIAIFPLLAGIFDMVPGLNWFFLIPTGFHVATLIMGVKGDLVSGRNAGANKQRLMIASAGLLALIVLSAIKTQSFFDTAEQGPKLASNRASATPDVKTAANPGQVAGVYVQIDPFTVNLTPDESERFLQTQITLQVSDQKEVDHFKLYMPLVRSRLLLLLSGKKASEISTDAGKKKLSEEILARLKVPFSDGGDPQKITDVFFTSFVIQ